MRGDPGVVILVADISHVHPGVAHFVDGPIAKSHPLIRIGIVGVRGGVVVPGRDVNDGAFGKHRRGVVRINIVGHPVEIEIADIADGLNGCHPAESLPPPSPCRADACAAGNSRASPPASAPYSCRTRPSNSAQYRCFCLTGSANPWKIEIRAPLETPSGRSDTSAPALWDKARCPVRRCPESLRPRREYGCPRKSASRAAATCRCSGRYRS